MSCRATSGALEGPPDVLGAAGHVDVVDAEVGDSVTYRVVHRRCGADRSRLADALRTQGVARAGRLGVGHLEAGQLRRNPDGVGRTACVEPGRVVAPSKGEHYDHV